MSYYMRYLIDDDKKIDLEVIETALKRSNPDYKLESKDAEAETATLMLGTALYGQVEINRRGSELLDEELEELLECIEDAEGSGADSVKQVLQDCCSMVALQVLWQGRDTESTLAKIDPLWKWLFSEYRGLLQADGEGFYNADGQML